MSTSVQEPQLRRRGCNTSAPTATTNGRALQLDTSYCYNPASKTLNSDNNTTTLEGVYNPPMSQWELPKEHINRNFTKRSLSESSAVEFHKPRGNGSVNNKTGEKMWHNESSRPPRNQFAPPHCKQSTSRSTGDSKSHIISDAVDVAIRVILVIVFIKLETTHPFRRKIQIEELWLYKNPRMPDIITPLQLLALVILCPFLTTVILYVLTRDIRDFRAGNWTWTLALGLNGLATSLLKLSVGRPRPDFFYRCFPDGVMVLNKITDQVQNGSLDILNCTGSLHDIIEGHKSFPSGHSSFAFVGFGFISMFLSAKLHAFSRGRGQSWRLCISISPLVLAALVAVSRTCDYHHHWQDVVVGSVIGLFTTHMVYRQYYPSIFSRNCHRPLTRDSTIHPRYGNTYVRLPRGSCSGNADYAGDVDAAVDIMENRSLFDDDSATAGTSESCPLICDDKQDNKWI